MSEFLGGLVRALQPDVVVELGAAWGGTTEQIVRALERNGHGFVVALEIDMERRAYTQARLRNTGSYCWTVRGDSSLEWTPVPDETPLIDFLFSDTAREIRCDELVRYAPWMRDGAIAAVHDSAWDAGPLRGWIENRIVTPGLARAIDLPTPRGLTLLEMNPRSEW